MFTPTTTNKLAATVNSLIAGLDKTILGVVYAAIIADVPWLGLPGLKQIWTWLFSWIAGYFTVAAENGATFLIIDLQTGAEQAKLSQAMKDLIKAEQSGDPVKIKEAIQNYANANSALIHSDGSSTAGT